MPAIFDDEDLSFPVPYVNGRSPAVSSPHGHHDAPPRPASVQPDLTLSDARAAQRLGQYTIIKSLGEGSFGKVKLAVHSATGQRVALKVISRRKLHNRDMVGRVDREIKYLQLLRHPHIIKLYTVILTDNEIIMVLEYAGGELFDYIVANGKMSEDAARRFFQQMICAVEYCHRHKVAHRDLKPENVLLDDKLNVKIADFGLSNIMTDGNFLKTSCGSPNYAAPEVIGGKLYAGPEVDVWSCGVILYVLLCGGLPFEDDYIPALFKKITHGTYTIPHYVSPGAANLIRRMLVVNPVHRITVQEIRQDPWFNKNLPDYLKPPVEAFIATGVDPNKAINPRSLAPGKPASLQEKLHDDVVGELGKAMGYAKDDVQDALGKDEPSAIKDAYLIVRENQIMRSTSRVPNSTAPPEPASPQFPPPMTSSLLSPASPASPSTPVQNMPLPPPRDSIDSPCNGDSSKRAVAEDLVPSGEKENELLEYASSIAVLPSSMPEYHRAYIARLKAEEEGTVPELNGQADASAQGPSEMRQSGNARPLQPTNRSQYSLDKAEHKPESLTPIPSKRPKQTKWQFGIRCRNPPLDAMYCIYRSLKRLGAEWEEPAMEHRPRIGGPKFGDSATEDDWHGGSGQNGSKRTGGAQGTDKDDNHAGQHDDGGLSAHELEKADPDPSEYEDYMPLDPWLIRCRWLKDGLTAGYGTQPCSGRSSTTYPDTPDPEHVGGSALPATTDRVYVYMEIQLYQIEPDFYLVDFKCAGYQRLLHDTVDDGDDGDAAVNAKDLEARMARLDLRTPEGSAAGVRHLNKLGEKLRGRRAKNERRLSREEEKVSSPFPFLDLASKLIAALAEGE